MPEFCETLTTSLPITGGHRTRREFLGEMAVLDDYFSRDVLSKMWWNLHKKTGYLRGNDTKRQLAHKIVFEHYFGPVPKGMQIDHKDRNKWNNAASNLR